MKVRMLQSKTNCQRETAKAQRDKEEDKFWVFFVRGDREDRAGLADVKIKQFNEGGMGG